MRYTFSILLALCSVFSPAMAQIQFNPASWSEILKESKSENKLIFFDAYTSWCGPCKYMAKSVFTDKAVGDFYNKNFINVKMDMEKGEGKELAKKFNVQGYPSLFFINSDEEVVHMYLGAQDVEGFIQLGQQASDPSTQMYSLEKKFAKGLLKGEKILDFASLTQAAGNPAYESIADAYLKDQNWSDTSVMKHIFEFSRPTISSKYMSYILKHRKKFQALIGTDPLNSKVEYASSADAREQKVNTYDLTELTQHMDNYYGKDEAKIKAQKAYLSSLMYSKKEKHVETFVEESLILLKENHPHGWRFYNSVAWELYANTEDKKNLKHALDLVDRSIQDDENFYNTDTKAHILYKLGKNIEALVWAKKSIELAEEKGYDASITQELIQKIENR